jgi:two-component sensor histidine kinase
LKIREKLGDKKTISYALNNLGLAHRARKDFSNALKYYKQSLLLKSANKDSVGIFNTLLNIGSCYQYAYQYDSSYYYANRAKVIAVALKKTQAIEEIDCQIAFALFNLKKIEEAKKILLRYAQLPQNLQTRATLMGTYQYLGNIAIEEKNYPAARVWLAKGITIAKDGNKLEALSGFYQVLSQCYELEKNYVLALKYQHLHENAQDTLYNIENARQVNEMSAVYESSEKEKEIVKLNAVQSYQQQEIERKKLERNLWLIAALVFLGLAFWTFRANRIIKQQKEIIQKALEEKETLNKEIHHRVKNNLQVISGLLSLQSALIKDEQALDAIKESANRVQSMSLIHQQLYQKENITAVNMKTYLLQLVVSIKNTYANKNVQIHCAFADTDLDVDTAIPLGLITNELLTNCFKYAFPTEKNNNIWLNFNIQNQIMELSIKDDGVGIPEGSDIKKSKSFGYKIINAFVQKLNATLFIINENGLNVNIKIPQSK